MTRSNKAKYNNILKNVWNSYRATLPSMNTSIEQVLSYVWHQQIRQRCFPQIVRCSAPVQANILRDIANQVAEEMRNAVAGFGLAYDA